MAQTQSKSIFLNIVDKCGGFTFKTSKSFYKEIGINQKRFGMICKDKIKPTIDEVKSICNYFKVDIKDFIN